jgi:hypothetical protein
VTATGLPRRLLSAHARDQRAPRGWIPTKSDSAGNNRCVSIDDVKGRITLGWHTVDTNPMRQRGFRCDPLAGASGWGGRPRDWGVRNPRVTRSRGRITSVELSGRCGVFFPSKPMGRWATPPNEANARGRPCQTNPMVRWAIPRTKPMARWVIPRTKPMRPAVRAIRSRLMSPRCWPLLWTGPDRGRGAGRHPLEGKLATPLRHPAG